MSGFFKLLLVLALLVGGAAEGSSPLWAKTEVTVAANDAATAGAASWSANQDIDQALQAAKDAVAGTNTKIETFSFTKGQIHVTVSRQARSYVLYRISVLKKWYDVRASAVATPQVVATPQ